MLKIESFTNLPFNQFFIVVYIVNIYCSWFNVLLLDLFTFSKKVLIVFKVIQLIVAESLIGTLRNWLM
jgi:hypothetical protein